MVNEDEHGYDIPQHTSKEISTPFDMFSQDNSQHNEWSNVESSRSTISKRLTRSGASILILYVISCFN